jgi:hypothetical protein
LRKLLKQSGRQDSNLRPPGPKPGAMTGLRYAPIDGHLSEFYFVLASAKIVTFFK